MSPRCSSFQRDGRCCHPSKGVIEAHSLKLRIICPLIEPMKKISSRQTRVLVAAFVLVPIIAAASPAVSVREAVQRAVITNPEVQASWHAFRASEEEQEVARGGYRPRVDLTAGIGLEDQRDPGLADRDYTRRDAAISLNQMVYDGFATMHEVSRLGHAKLTRYFEVLDASETTALEAVRAYADVLRYRELVTLARDNFARHKEVYDQIEERVGAGVGRRVDFEQASGRLALAESNLLTEASNLHDVSARYQRIVGELPGDSLQPIGELDGGIPPQIGEALRLAYEGHPAFHAAVENVRAANAEAKGRKAPFQPRIDLRARHNLEYNTDGIAGPHRDRVVELVLNYNLLNGGADRAAVRQYAERLNLAHDLRDKACRDIRQTLAIAYNDVNRLGEQLRYLDQHQLSISKAREAYRKQFDIGQRTLLDLLDTENEYFQARRAFVNAGFDHQTAYARVLAGMGQLLPALQVAREGLPNVADLVNPNEEVDPPGTCPTDAPEGSAMMKTAMPVAPVAAVAADAAADDVTVALETATRNWAQAWESKIYPAYRDFYSDRFTPADGQSMRAWERVREQRLGKRGPISVTVEDLQVQQLGPDVAATVFSQRYASNSYRDVVTKRLEWVRENGRWQITRESAM